MLKITLHTDRLRICWCGGLKLLAWTQLVVLVAGSGVREVIQKVHISIVIRSHIIKFSPLYLALRYRSIIKSIIGLIFLSLKGKNEAKHQILEDLL